MVIVGNNMQTQLKTLMTAVVAMSVYALMLLWSLNAEASSSLIKGPSGEMELISSGPNEAGAVKVTLGLKGRNIRIEKNFGAPTITKYGVDVTKDIELTDKFENSGAQIVKEAAPHNNKEIH